MVREPRSCLAGKYSYSIPEFNLGFHFPVLPVSVFCLFPGQFPFPVLPRANPTQDPNCLLCYMPNCALSRQIPNSTGKYLPFYLYIKLSLSLETPERFANDSQQVIQKMSKGLSKDSFQLNYDASNVQWWRKSLVA